MKNSRSLFFETLESRRLLATGEPSAEEQFMLELINRARLDPLGEVQRNVDVSDLNQGLPAGTISAAAKPPVAFHPQLIEAARNHNRWMLATGNFSHTGANGSTIEQRVVDAQYAPSGTFTVEENLSVRGTSGAVNLPAFVELMHNDLFKSTNGHRQTLMNPSLREIGISVEVGIFNGRNSAITTNKYATRGSQVFLTGVVYNDQVKADRFYTIGEGLGGVSVTAKRLSDGKLFTTSTYGAGGYQIELAPGVYEVQFSGGGVAGTISQLATLGNQNEKLDLNTANVSKLLLTLEQSIISEVGGNSNVTVTRQTTDLTNALTVSLNSSLTTEATVPATVTIPANEISATFILNAVDEAIVDLVQSSVILASAPGFANASVTVHVVDNDGPSLWRNPLNPFDVDGNGSLDPFDVLAVINRLARNGIGLLPNTPLNPPLFYDVNGDWQATPLDVLNVINAFNRLGTNGEGEASLGGSSTIVTPFTRIHF